MKTLEQVRQEMLAKAMSQPLAKYSLKDSDGKVVVSSNSPVSMPLQTRRMRLLPRVITSSLKNSKETMAP